jgi:hypothetical protein
VILSLLTTILLILPGIVIVSLLLKKINYSLPIIEVLLSGSIVWIYLFISVTTLLAIFSTVTLSFSIFFYVGLAICLIGFPLIVIRFLKRREKQVIAFNAQDVALTVFLFALIVILSIFSLTQGTLFTEYDAVKVYLPLAKSIVSTGGLHYDAYQVNGLTTTAPPAIPLIFAYIMSQTGEANLSGLPILFLILTVTAVFLLTKELFSKKVAFISAIIFFSLPVVSGVFITFNLYLDLAFVFFITSSLFFLVKALKSSPKYYVLAGTSISLCFLTSSISVFITPILVLIAMLTTPIARNKIAPVLSGILFGATFTLLFIWDYMSAPTMKSLFREVLVIIFSLLIFILVRRSALKETAHNKFNFKYILLGLLTFIPAIAFIARNIVVFGAITKDWIPWNSAYMKAYLSLNRVELAAPAPLNILSYLRFDYLFTTFLLSALFIAPMIIGLFALWRTPKKSSITLAIILLSGFALLWSWQFNCSFQGAELRRLYYFAPLFAVIIAFGISVMEKYTEKHYFIERFLIYDSLVFAYFLFRINSRGLPLLSSAYYTIGLANLFDILFCASLFIVFFCLNINPLFANKPKSWGRLNGKLIRSSKHALSLTLVLSLIILIIPVGSILSTSTAKETYEKNIAPNYENGILNVANYYNTNITDNYITVTFYGFELAWYANRTVLDFTKPEEVAAINPALESTNNSEIINFLLEHNVRYFLLPKEGHSHFGLYERYSKYFQLFQIINEEPNFKVVQDFPKMTLYKLLSAQELSFTLAYYTSFSNYSPLTNESNIKVTNASMEISSNREPSIKTICDDNQTGFWSGVKADKTDTLILKESSTAISGNSSLEVDIYRKEYMTILHSYTKPQNWTGWQYISVYFYGQNTSKIIPLTFHTNPWKDYYAANIADDFTGWKKLSFLMDSLRVTGKPSWNSISQIEMPLGNLIEDVKLKYYFDDFKLENKLIGATTEVHKITPLSTNVKIVMNIQVTNDTIWNMNIISATNNKLLWNSQLKNGFNSFVIPSEVFQETTTICLNSFETNTTNILDLSRLYIVRT